MSEEKHDDEVPAPTDAPAEQPGTHDATGLQPLLGDALSAAVKRLLARSRVELGRAARSGRRGLELRQAQRDLEHFWMRMGKSAYHLVNAGELDHPQLRKAMARIDELEARIDALRQREASSED